MPIVSRQGLLNVLNTVKPALNKSEKESVFIFGNGYIEAFNGEIAIRGAISLKGFDLEGMVLSEGLFSSISKMNSEKVDVKKSGGEVVITAGRIKAGIPLIEDVTYRSILDGEDSEWSELPEGFLNALEMCQFAVGPETAPPTESCVFVDLKAGKAVACDGFRASRHVFKKSNSGTKFLLPGKVISSVLGFEPTQISVPSKEGFVRFRNEKSTIAVTIFPNGDREAEHQNMVEQLFKLPEIGELTFPETLPDIVQRTSIFAKEEMSDDDHVDILVNDGVMAFSSSGIRGWIEEEVDSDYKGEEISFSVSAPFLDDVVKLGHRNAKIAEDRMMFYGDGWEHIVSRFIV